MSSIYLSKSNLASPQKFAMVKLLFELDASTQVRYFQGGAYTDQPLLTSDKLILLLPDNATECVGSKEQGYYKATIGKGQYEQIRKFAEVHGSADIYVITKTSADEVTYSQLRSILHVNHSSGDWNRYATITFYSHQSYSTKKKKGPVVVNIRPDTFKFKEEEPKRRRLILLHKGF